MKKEGTKGEYWTMLKSKLQEEVTDFLQSPTEKELVDIYEVMNAIYDFKGIKKSNLKKILQRKIKTKGSFTSRLK